MKCMAMLVFGLLMAALVPRALAQDNEAEKLFRDMEMKIEAAKAIQVTVDIELRAIKGREKESKIGNGVSKGKATLLLTKENQARLKVRNEFLGIMLISDGKQLKLLSDQGDLSEAEARPTPDHLHNLLSTLVSRLGVTGGSTIVRFAPGPQFEPLFLRPAEPGEKGFDATQVESWAVWGFKMGAATKVGGRDAKVITYNFGPKGERPSKTATLWVDSKTRLPLKSIVVVKHSENLHITETYTEFNLNPKIDTKVFALDYQVNDAEKLFRAMEEKIKAAKAVEVTFEFTARAKDKEEKFKGSLAFTKDNKARLKMQVLKELVPEGENTIELVSDGKQMKVVYPPKETVAMTEALQAPADLHSLFSTMVSGPSLSLTYDMLNVPEWFPEPGKYTGPGRWPFRLVEFDFVAGDATKVSGRNAKVITYRVLDLPGPGRDCMFTLWIDAETLLPLKRLMVFDETEGEAGRITEICTVSLNAKINAEAFILPK